MFNLITGILAAVCLVAFAVFSAGPGAHTAAPFCLTLGLSLLLLAVIWRHVARRIGYTAAGFLVLAAIGAGVSGCAPLQPGAPGFGGVTFDSSDVPLVIAKADYGFEAAYNVAGHAYLDAVAAGLPEPTKSKAKAGLAAAYGIVKTARDFAAAGNAQGVAEQTALLQTALGEVLALLPKK